ncbi:MAG: penicillin acylase family protein, partial [Verrucomicrobia bacterium]
MDLHRDAAGVMHLRATHLDDAFWALGYCHAMDRGLQLILTRLVGAGRLSEHLRAGDEAVELDTFFRKLNFAGDVEATARRLTPRARAACEAYCGGVNHRFSRHGLPWELRLLRVPFAPWSLADLMIVARLMGYMGMAQTQATTEHLLVQWIQHGLDRVRLEELFPGRLGGLDETLLRQVTLAERVVPSGLPWGEAAVAFAASNNWAVSGALTASGRPILANDPHLDINRLPPVWYETVLEWRHHGRRRYAMGASLPGVPGIVVGRTPDLAWGVTYAFMDVVDSWVEHCREGRHRRGEGWEPFRQRREIIRRRRGAPVELTVHENDHGILEGAPREEAWLLCTRWSGAEPEAVAASLEAVCAVLEAEDARQGRTALAGLVNGTWNWVLADRHGHIAYQMAGLCPRRRPGVSGLFPLPGWDPANDWQGWVPPEELPRQFDPPEGFIITANDDLNALGRVQPINFSMGPYRSERIRRLLQERRPLTVADMQRIQLDVRSAQAERYLELLRPLLAARLDRHPETARALLDWDGAYRPDSRAATIFEHFYAGLIEEVFGAPAQGNFGPRVLAHLRERTPVLSYLFATLDRVLLRERSAWFGRRTREEVYRAALDKALARPAPPYGHDRTVRIGHLLLGDRLPWVPGLTRQVRLPGGRATVFQGQIHRLPGRTLTIAPSYRLVTDLAEDAIHTA